MTLPIERFKDAYENWRWNPFTSDDYAIDKEEDNLAIPAGAPFVVQLLEVPRKNTPTTVLVRAYDTETDVDDDSASGQKVLKVTSTVGFSDTDKIIINRGGAREEECVIFSIQAGISLTMVDNLTETHTGVQADDVEKYIEFTEVAGAPAQSQFRVDYPPADGEGTGLIEFNNADNSKIIRINYKATGSPMLSEYLDTKVSFPAGNSVDNQILAFVSGAPTWKYNPKPYFHEGPVIYNVGGEAESCLLFRFKRRAEDQKVLLELKGAKLHQGFYSELFEHNHGVGTLAADAVGTHSHTKGTLSADAVGTHIHGKGTIATSSGGVAHTHGVGTLTVGNESSHTHTKGTLAVGNESDHNHGVGTLVNAGANAHGHDHGTLAGSQAKHSHTSGSLVGSTVDHTHTVNGSTGDQSASHKHAIVDGTQGSWDWQTGNQLASHHHSMNFASGGATPSVNITGSVTLAGNEAVTISGGVAGGGAHNHIISGDTADAGSHSHALSGTLSAGSAHNHGLTGSTASHSIAHIHAITGDTAADGGHGHTISGSTAAGGGHGHTMSGSLPGSRQRLIRTSLRFILMMLIKRLISSP